MKRTLLLLVFGLSILSFTFADTKYDKYQAIKEGGEYYNQLQKIYNSDSYMSRHSNAVISCLYDLNKSKEANSCLPGRPCKTAPIQFVPLSPVLMIGATDNDNFCKHPAQGMNAEEEKIFRIVYDTKVSDERAEKDNKCYQSMNGYYSEKADSCVCDEGYSLNGGVCKEDIKEVVDVIEDIAIDKDIATGEEEKKADCSDNLIKLICSADSDSCPKECQKELVIDPVVKALGEKDVKILNSLVKKFRTKDSVTQAKFEKLFPVFKKSKKERDRNIGIYFEYLWNN